MSRIAFISDVHADVHALRDALAQVERLGCDLVLCAGDLIDWGLFPEETLDLLRTPRVPCIRGNHDRWALREGHDMSGWDLTRRSLEHLESLPTRWSKTIDGVRVAMWHARPESDMDGIDPARATEPYLHQWLAEAEADVLIVGHTHLTFALSTSAGGLIANPGALLRDPAHPMERAMIFDRETGEFVPGPEPEGGTFGILELPSRRFAVHRAADGVEVSITTARSGLEPPVIAIHSSNAVGVERMKRGLESIRRAREAREEGSEP